MTWIANSVAAVPTRPSIDSAPGDPLLGRATGAAPDHDRGDGRITPTMAATMRWAKWRIWSSATAAFGVEGGHERAVEQRPVGVDERRAAAPLRPTPTQVISVPNSSSAKTETAANATSRVDALRRAALRQDRRVARADGEEQEDGQQDHRRREVRGDRLRRVGHLHGDLAQVGLEADHAAAPRSSRRRASGWRAGSGRRRPPGPARGSP